MRWDYAFFQMVVETNGLKFHRGDGRSGDVNPRQYNFAGLGTTGGGVPGDTYADSSAGVLAQIQHLVVYSGERIERPIGSRTQLKQDDIISGLSTVSRRRPVTFQDLAGRWAADRGYGRTIESVAERYRSMFCNGREPAIEVVEAVEPPTPKPAVRPQQKAAEVAADTGVRQVRAITVKPSGLGMTPPPRPLLMAEAGSGARCKVLSASYGGSKAVLIRATVNGEQHLTSLQVPDGSEAAMTDSFMRVYAPGGTAVGEFPSPERALDHAYKLCQQAALTGPAR